MTKHSLFLSLLIGSVTQAVGQTVIQGDTLFLDLQIRKSSTKEVKAQLGHRYRAEKTVSVGTALTTDGTCITTKTVTGISLRYPARGLTCYINTNTTKRRMGLALIAFDSTANVSSAKGIQPGKHRFSDVLAQYGPIDFEKKDNSLPAAREMSNEEGQWFTVLVFPTIRFISSGRKQSGENLLLRPVTGIWLENQY